MIVQYFSCVGLTSRVKFRKQIRGFGENNNCICSSNCVFNVLLTRPSKGRRQVFRARGPGNGHEGGGAWGGVPFPIGMGSGEGAVLPSQKIFGPSLLK